MDLLTKILIIIAISLLKMLPLQSQNLFQVELSEAFVFYDLIREPNDIANAYKGYGTHTSLDFWLGKKVSPRLELKAGLGYSFFWNWNYAVSDNSSYLDFKLASNFKVNKSLKFSATLSNYLLLHKEKQDEIRQFQTRLFTNIDIGAEIRINRKLGLTINSPITILPIAKSREGVGIFTPDGPIKQWVEMWGIRLGVIYNIN